MKPFQLKIVTPDGLLYDGNAYALTVRTTTGDMGILGGHTNCVAPLGMGRATVQLEDGPDGKRRSGACIGGMLSVVDNQVTVVATTFEWAENIDVERLLRSEQRARDVLSDEKATDVDIKLAQARLRRALVRKSVAENR